MNVVATHPSGCPNDSSPVHKSSNFARVCSANERRPPFIDRLPGRRGIPKMSESDTRGRSCPAPQVECLENTQRVRRPYRVERIRTKRAFRWGFGFLHALVMTQNGIEEVGGILNSFEAIESFLENPSVLLPFKESRMRPNAHDAWPQRTQRAFRGLRRSEFFASTGAAPLMNAECRRLSNASVIARPNAS